MYLKISQAKISENLRRLSSGIYGLSLPGLSVELGGALPRMKRPVPIELHLYSGKQIGMSG
jgi:hypothetical protein